MIDSLGDIFEGLFSSSYRTEKIYIARHEAAHALLYMLAGENILKAEIQFLRESTLVNIRRLLGPTVTLHTGEVSIGDRREKEFRQEEPYKDAIVAISGLANTLNDNSIRSFLDEGVEESLANGIEEEWVDTAAPYKYITDRFNIIKEKEPSKEEISRIFYALLEQVHEIFQEVKFKKALEKIAELIKGRKLRNNINAIIIRELKYIGLSEQDLQIMSRRIYSIDVDELIRNDESSRPSSL